MVKSKRENNAKNIAKQVKLQSAREPAKINATTSYELCDTRLTAFGGLLVFTKFLDSVKFSDAQMTDEEMAKFIRDIHKYLAATVKQVLVKGDTEFIGGKTITACEECAHKYIFVNKRCAAVFPEKQWYKWTEYNYNKIMYQSKDWEKACRFVVMRIKGGILAIPSKRFLGNHCFFQLVMHAYDL